MHPADELRRLQERYRTMSDGELESIAATAYELTDEAQSALRDEIRRRSLDIELAPEPAVDNAPKFAELVTVRRYSDMAEAMFAKSLLEDAGIESFLADENTIRMNWFYANALGGMRLQVRSQDVEQATAVLDSPWVLPKEPD